MLTSIHHIAIICSNYERSKTFYREVLGLRMLAEEYRQERDSWKADFALDGRYIIELFSFPDPPPRPTHPEACGLRHLAFGVKDLDKAVATLRKKGVACEEARVDTASKKRFTFFQDPDGLPIELYEQ